MGGRKALIAPLLLGIWLAFAAPAHARGVELRASGGIRLEWHGDSARGCEAAGVCGYSGTGSYSPGSTGTQLQGPFDLEILDGSMVVRVTRDGGDLCVDRVDASDLVETFVKRHAALGSFGALSAGRCAGPALDPALATLRVPRIPRSVRPGQSIDLSGSSTFTSGPFAGTVSSTLRLRAVSSNAESDTFYTSGGGNGRKREPRYAMLGADFDVSRLSGAAHVAFDGLPSPECIPLGACGAHGTSSFAVDTRRGSIDFTFVVRVPRRARNARRAVLAALRSGRGEFLNDGSLDYESIGVRGIAITDVARDGAPACHAAARLGAPDFAVTQIDRTLRVELGGAETGSGTDVFGTFCPGPLQVDMFGSGPLGAASIPATAVLRRSLVMRLRRAGRFSASGYAGVRNTGFTLRMRRRSLSMRFTRGIPF